MAQNLGQDLPSLQDHYIQKLKFPPVQSFEFGVWNTDVSSVLAKNIC